MIRLREIPWICQRETEYVPRQLFYVCRIENRLERKSEYPHSSGTCTDQRRCGAIVEVDLEALRRVLAVKTKLSENQQKSVRIVCGQVVRDIVNTQQVHQSARRPLQMRERMVRHSIRERRNIARAVETLVNPTEVCTGSRIMATLQWLQSWRDAHVKILQ